MITKTTINSSLFLLSLILTSPTVWSETVVNTTAHLSEASEGGPTPGVFALTRSGDLTTSLTVHYQFGGTATLDDDYLVWETSAVFEAGSDVVFVTVLPKNDAIEENTETVSLTLESNSAYTIGADAQAEITIEDVFFENFPGVFDPIEFPVLEKDITYLDAFIENGFLNIIIGLNATPSTNLVVFLDTDQNPSTGDQRNGFISGAEFRILGLVKGFIVDYQLSRLPRSVTENEILITSGNASFNNNFYVASIPLQFIDNPINIDVIATTFKVTTGGNSADISANGDRAPEYGAFDTSSRQVVLRRNAITQSVNITDERNDVRTPTGFDLVSANYSAIADQFQLVLEFAQGFDPTQVQFFPGPRGEITFDSDRSLTTGGLFMGADIPSWGGDARLVFDLKDAFQELHLEFDATGLSVKFGETANDGRWLAGAAFGEPNKLVLRGSLSMLDTFNVTRTIVAGKNFDQATRISAAGPTRFEVFSVELGPSLFDALVADALPGHDRVVDTAVRQLLDPLVFDPDQIITQSDPAEFGFGGSGIDLIQVDAQIIAGNLIVKGTLSSWLNTQTGNLFQIALDVDNDVTTGKTIINSLAAGAPSIGADFLLKLVSLDGFVPFYVAQLDNIRAGVTVTSFHDALVSVNPQSQIGIPASFTVTLPLSLLGNIDPTIHFFVTAGQNLGAELDVAPPQPISIAVRDAFTNVIIKLSEGFNLFSYPFVIPSDINGCIDLITELGSAEEIRYIKRYNPTTQTFEQCNHLSGSNFEIVPGEAYIVNSVINKNQEVTGMVTCPDIGLSKGMNFIGYQGLINSSCFELLSINSDAQSLQRFNENTGRFESCFMDRASNNPVVQGLNFSVVPGKGYILHTINSGSYFLPGCN